MANLEQSGRPIPVAWSGKLTFSLVVIFYLSKNENRTKKTLNTALILLLLVKVLNLPKNADISKIKGVLELKGILSKTSCVCIHTYQISSF